MVPVWALLGQGCEMPPGSPVGTTPAKEICSVQTPQVYIMARTTYTAAQLAQIHRDVVAPIESLYSDDAHGHVVSITILKKDRNLLVEIVVDQTTSDDPVFESVLLEPARDGSFHYTPTDAGPGYAG